MSRGAPCDVGSTSPQILQLPRAKHLHILPPCTNAHSIKARAARQKVSRRFSSVACHLQPPAAVTAGQYPFEKYMAKANGHVSDTFLIRARIVVSHVEIAVLGRGWLSMASSKSRVQRRYRAQWNPRLIMASHKCHLALLQRCQPAYAINWTRLFCSIFRGNEVRLQLQALASNLGNLPQRADLPEEVADWSLTSIQSRLIKLGARVVRHARKITFQLAEVAVNGPLFGQIITAIRNIKPPPRLA